MILDEFKKIREKLDLTQEELAQVLGMSSFQTISHIETGVRNPSRLTMAMMRIFLILPMKRSKELREMILMQLPRVEKAKRNKRQ